LFEIEFYYIKAVPVEYNCWILFRCIEDFILVNDFTSYCCFSFRLTKLQFGITDILRYIGAALLIYFNVWVKHDAHRVVKDFAWCKYKFLNDVIVFFFFFFFLFFFFFFFF